MEKHLVPGIGWYRREQWTLLKAASLDSDELSDTYDGWLANAEKSLAELRALGQDFIKVDIDVEELIQWCVEHKRPVNGQNRAEFITEKLAELHGSL